MSYSKGDHLVTNIDVAGVFEHHGIYVGSGQVIHFTAEDGKVVETGLGSFSDGSEIRIKRQASDPEEAVRRARNRIGETGYNLATNNCEHFVNECIDGRKTSNQTSRQIHVSAHAGALMAGGALARVASGPVAGVVLVSAGAKMAAEYVGAPHSVSTIIGVPGDLVGKPLEAAFNGVTGTVGNTLNKLGEGEVVDAAAELIGGTFNTAVDIIEAPFEVVGDVFSAIGSIFD